MGAEACADNERERIDAVKTVVITGGTQGIGADIAQVFLEVGYQVLIGSRHRSGLAEIKHEHLFFYGLLSGRPKNI